MASKSAGSITFEIDKVIQPIYTGGDVSISANGLVLATCVEEEALLTNPETGEALCRIEGDGEILTALQITPSVSHLIACSRSLSMRIYSLERPDDTDRIEATLLRTLKPHTTPVVCATVDRTGTLLATGGADSSIKVWDIRGGFATHTFRGHSGIISALRFFEAQNASSSHGQPQAKKDKKGRKSEAEQDMIMLDDQEQVQITTNASFRLASGGDDGKVRVWDLVKRKAIASLESHVAVVRGLDYSPEQDALVSSSRDRTLIIWDAKTWKVRKVIPAYEDLEDSIFIHGGQYICAGGGNGCVRVWISDSGKEVTEAQEAGGDADALMKLLPAQKDVLMSVHADQSLVLLSTESLSSLDPDETITELAQIRRISGTHDEVIDLAYVSPERTLLALATNSESIRLVSVAPDDLESEEPRYFGSDVALLEGHEDIIICIAVDWSGCWIATGAKDNTAKLWRIDEANDSFECWATMTGHAESLGAIALPTSVPQPDSNAFKDPLSHPPEFVITGSQDKTVKRWSIAGQGDKKGSKAIYTRRAHDKDINAIATNHTSTLFASASQDRTVKIWSIEDGEVQGLLQGHKRGVWSVQFAPKDTPSISGEDNTVSGSRGTILTGAGDKTVKIWSLASFTCLRTFEGSTNSVLKVLWLPKRQAPEPLADDVDDMDEFQEPRLPQAPRTQATIIASAGADGLVRLWDAQTGEPATTLDNHTDRIWALAAHPTNGTLISGGADSVVTFWKDTTSETATSRARDANERIEQGQELDNHVHKGNYREAIVLALTLNHPGKLLNLFTQVGKKSPDADSLSGLKAVDEVIATLSDDQLYKLLLRLRDWSTNARTAPVAQRILWVVVRSYPATRLVELSQGKGRKSLGDVFAAIQAYTERHYKRMEELLEESYIVDFVVRGMGEEGFVAANGNTAEHERDVIMVE